MKKLTVSYRPSKRAEVPFLRMCGKWLAGAGFTIGKRVSVRLEGKSIIITPVDEAQS